MQKWKEFSDYEGEVWSDNNNVEEAYKIEIIKQGIENENLIPQGIPLSKLLDKSGKVPGKSSEPDDSKEFAARTIGLDLEAYEINGKSPPIIIVKIKKQLIIADGRHRTIKLTKYNKNVLIANIQAFILNINDPIIQFAKIPLNKI